jgi:hypothetical protein
MSNDNEDDFELDEFEYNEDDFEEISDDDINNEDEDDTPNFQDIDEDDDNNGSLEDFVDEDLYENYATPFFSVYSKKIPNKFNPKEIMRKNSVLLFNPFDHIEPYREVNPRAIDFEMLSTSFIVEKKSFSMTDNLNELSRYKKMVKGNKTFIEAIDSINNQKDDDTNEFNNKNNNYNNNSGGGGIKPSTKYTPTSNQ